MRGSNRLKLARGKSWLTRLDQRPIEAPTSKKWSNSSPSFRRCRKRSRSVSVRRGMAGQKGTWREHRIAERERYGVNTPLNKREQDAQARMVEVKICHAVPRLLAAEFTFRC